MNNTASPSPPPREEGSLKLPLGALSLSAIIHATVILIIGGYVIFEGVVPKTPFMATEGMVIPEDSLALPAPPDLNEETPLPEITPLTQVLETTPTSSEIVSETLPDVISASVANPLFQLPASSPAPTAALPRSSVSSSERTPSAPDSSQVMHQLFGSREQAGGALVGTFYDLKTLKSGKPSPARDSNQIYQTIIREFTDKNWDPGLLKDYFRAGRQLQATQFYIPLIPAREGPDAFEVEGQVQPMRWIVHYQGLWSPRSSGRFRFVGAGGEILIVRFNRKIVLDASHSFVTRDKPVTSWNPGDELGRWRVFPPGTWDSERLIFGEWIKVDAGVNYPLEILLGERGGGDFYAFLFEEGLGPPTRETNPSQKAFPVFSTIASPAVPSLPPEVGSFPLR